MGIVVFIRIGYGRFGGYLGHLGCGGHLVSGILCIIDFSYIGSFWQDELLRSHALWDFLRSWDFCTYQEVLLGEHSTRYATQINALHGFITLLR